ncbi:EF-hand domain-containing protein [Longispora albida]|uniref:EF-hand domain-containing protein n=1 Tax=Longispora albida TaxID=203523 RepID=UPI00036CD2AB|nr:EF-hand domain-containing protein [Longispora albida]
MNENWHRAQARFRMMDVNGNGHLDRRDFELLALQVIEALGEPAQSVKSAALIAGYRDYWHTVIAPMDSDGDGQVSAEEYAQGAVSVAALPGGRPQYAAPIAALADRDGDGMIELDDFVACMTAVGFSPGYSGTLYAELADPTGGRLATGAWVAEISRYYTADAIRTSDDLLAGEYAGAGRGVTRPGARAGSLHGSA